MRHVKLLMVLLVVVCMTPSAVAAQVHQKLPRSIQYIDVFEPNGELTFTGSEIRLCGAQEGATVTTVLRLTMRRTQVSLHNVRMCTVKETPQLTISAINCFPKDYVPNPAISESCSWE